MGEYVCLSHPDTEPRLHWGDAQMRVIRSAEVRNNVHSNSALVFCLWQTWHGHSAQLSVYNLMEDWKSLLNLPVTMQWIKTQWQLVRLSQVLIRCALIQATVTCYQLSTLSKEMNTVQYEHSSINLNTGCHDITRSSLHLPQDFLHLIFSPKSICYFESHLLFTFSNF